MSEKISCIECPYNDNECGWARCPTKIEWKYIKEYFRKISVSRREKSERICKYCDNYISEIMVNEECCKVDGCPLFKEPKENEYSSLDLESRRLYRKEKEEDELPKNTCYNCHYDGKFEEYCWGCDAWDKWTPKEKEPFQLGKEFMEEDDD